MAYAGNGLNIWPGRAERVSFEITGDVRDALNENESVRASCVWLKLSVR